MTINNPIDADREKCHVRSADAEIAIFSEDNHWFVFDSKDGWTDTVKGWVGTDEVADWIHKVKTAKCLEELGEVRDMSLDSILGKE